jgi:tetratricopeptide (TPR) repeat protein
MTDQNGGFVFTNLAPGSYTVTVDAGENFEIFRETVVIDGDVKPPPGVVIPPTPKVFSVLAYLRPKNATKKSDQQAPGVVNVKYADAPPDAIKHYEKGLELEKSNKGDEALSEFKQAVAIYPAFEPAYVESGKIYLKKPKLGEAIDAFSLAVRYDPKDFDARLNYGIALYRDNRLDDAQKELLEAATLNASAVWPHYYLGLIYIQKKDLDDAQTQLETAKSLKGDNNIPLLHRALGGIYAAKKMNSQAAAELEKYIQLSPDARDAERIRQTIAELKNNKN